MPQKQLESGKVYGILAVIALAGIVVVSAAMAGVYWIAGRREKMMSQAALRQTQDAGESTEGKED